MLLVNLLEFLADLIAFLFVASLVLAWLAVVSFPIWGFLILR